MALILPANARRSPRFPRDAWRIVCWALVSYPGRVFVDGCGERLGRPGGSRRTATMVIPPSSGTEQIVNGCRQAPGGPGGAKPPKVHTPWEVANRSAIGSAAKLRIAERFGDSQVRGCNWRINFMHDLHWTLKHAPPYDKCVGRPTSASE